jgi:hypothetical protein
MGEFGRLTKAIAVGAFVVAGTAVLPQAAFADEATVRIHSLRTDRYLDTNGTGIYTLPYAGAGNQEWTRVAVGAEPGVSYFAFKNINTGKCLDADWGAVYPSDCNGGDYQTWGNAHGTNELKSVATGLCLDSNEGGAVYVGGCGSDYQRWEF